MHAGHTTAATLSYCDPLLLAHTSHSRAAAHVLPGFLEQGWSPSSLTLPQLQMEQHQGDL